MENKKIILAIAFVLGAIISAVGIEVWPSSDNQLGYSGAPAPIYGLTQTSIMASTTPTLLASADTGFLYGVFSNADASNPAFLFFNSTSTGISSSSARNGILVAPRTTFSIKYSDSYLVSDVYVITQSGTTTVSYSKNNTSLSR